MSRLVQNLASLGLVSSLAVACSDDVTTPEIVLFESDLAAVATGRPVQLSWQVRNAERVDIVAQPDTLILDGSRESTGRIQSPPIQRTTIFRLDAVGGGTTVSATARVTALGSSDSVRIVDFQASPSAIRPGESSELSWTTVGASSATLRTVDGIILSTNPGLPNGTFTVEPNGSTDYELELVGVGGVVSSQTRVTVLRPEVREFSVTPASIQRGESAVLRWAVAQANDVRIEDASGMAVVEDAALTGQLSITPDQSTTYRLIASDGTEQAEASAAIEVTEPLQAEIASFVAAPTSVRLGETSTLTWEVRNASRGIEIRVGETVVAQTTRPTGSIVVRPAETTRYDLEALSLGGDASASATVELVPSPPAILTFQATPNPAVRGEETRVEWVVLGADSITLTQGATVIGADLEPSGSLPAPIADASTRFRMTAVNTNGASSQDLTVAALERPEVLSFRASPRSFISVPARVTLNWSTRFAAALELTANNVPVAGFPPAGYDPAAGQFALDINQTTLFALTALNDATTTPAQVIVGESSGEQEPNDEAATAQSLGSGGQIRGEIDSGSDVDWFEVDVPSGGNVRVETSDGAGSCGSDTRLRLFGNSDRSTPIIDEDAGGIGACALIDPVADGRAVDLDDSPYFIEVSTSGDIGGYVLDVTTAAASCGNRIRERSPTPPEQCDDGPAGSADCDGSCARIISPIQTVGALGSALVSSGLNTIGQRDYVRVEVGAGGGFVTARTWAPVEGECTAGTELVLFDANFDEIDRVDGSDFDNCAALHPDRQPAVGGANGAGLAAGTYYLEIGDAGDDESIAAYVVDVESVATGCGNGVLESGESCDDGNVIAADGCSASCATEGTTESEPNDATMNATSAGNLSAATFLHGDLEAADIDTFSFVVPSNRDGYSLTATVTDGRGSCRAWSGGTDATIAVLTSTGATLASDASRTAAACSALLPRQQSGLAAMTPGTYYVRVEPGAIGVDGRYLVDLRLSAPVCGNAVREGVEECDDGNAAAGDGCDACRFEVAVTADFAVTATATWTATVAPDAYTVAAVENVPAGGSVDVEVFDTGTRTCPRALASVLFVDATFRSATPLYNQRAGICNPVPASSSLAAGDYYILVANIDGTGSETFDIELTLRP